MPLSLLRAAVDTAVLIELRNGDTYNGTLESIDNFMNLYLHNVIHTSRDADKFVELKQVYLRGNQIKYLRVPNEIMEKVKDDNTQHSDTAGMEQ